MQAPTVLPGQLDQLTALPVEKHGLGLWCDTVGPLPVRCAVKGMYCALYYTIHYISLYCTPVRYIYPWVAAVTQGYSGVNSQYRRGLAMPWTEARHIWTTPCKHKNTLCIRTA